jgi:hypothetical protein
LPWDLRTRFSMLDMSANREVGSLCGTQREMHSCKLFSSPVLMMFSFQWVQQDWHGSCVDRSRTRFTYAFRWSGVPVLDRMAAIVSSSVHKMGPTTAMLELAGCAQAFGCAVAIFLR